MNPSQKRVLKWAGSSISIAGVIYVGLRLNEYASQLDLARLDAFTWSAVAASALIYALANGLLALSWWKLLGYFGAAVDRWWAWRVYGLTQPAKYVPGNIMQLASRQAIGMADGVSGWALAKSSLWELGLICTAGAYFFCLVAPKYLPMVSMPVSAVGFVGACLLTMIVLMRIFSRSIAGVFALYLLFLLVSGAVFVGLLVSLTGTEWITLPLALTIGGAFILAWVLGLVTPGAPAGIGVREIVLLALLGGAVPEAELLLAVLLSRAVTICGDFLFFLVCLGMAKIDVRSTV